jgi:hypothetical protein
LTETSKIIESQYQAEDRPVEASVADKTGTETRRADTLAGSFNMRKRIGSTTYEVEVRFNPESRETLDEKILRLIRSEAE